jgi:regulator of sirC expression with transglutaminase-like and TPR domain
MGALLENSPSRALLERALRETPPRLDWASLAVAMLEHPDLDVEACERALDRLAERVQTLAALEDTTWGRVSALKRVLADEEGFRGDIQTYAAAQNCFLNVVLERRQGLPITLGVLYMEVARRAGIELFGVGFPGHFVVAAQTGQGKLVMDPFQGGTLLTESGLAALLNGVAPQLRFSPAMLTPTPVKSITARLLMNLKRSYQASGDQERILRVIDQLLILSPDHPGELRARAAVLSTLGAYRAALADVERCLELSPQAPDSAHLLFAASSLRHRVDHLN